MTDERHLVEIGPGMKIDRRGPVAWWLAGSYDYRGIYGGRGSGKSRSAIEAMVVTGLVRKTRMLVARATQKSMKDSVRQEFIETTEDLGVHGQVVPMEDRVKFKRTGSEVVFKGVNHESATSLRSMASGIGICFLEEAHEIKEDPWRILLPSLRPRSSMDRMEVWFALNPTHPDDPVFRDFVTNRRGGTRLKLLKMNWRDNKWFPRFLEDQRNHDEQHLPREMYDWVWEGMLKPTLIEEGVYPLLTMDIVQSCIDAWPRRPRVPYGSPTLGWDVADLYNPRNGLCVRHGPCMLHNEAKGFDSWQAAGSYVDRLHERYECRVAYFDATGIGSAARSELSARGVPNRPVQFGSSPRAKNASWLPGRSNAEHFEARNMQMAWVLRLRAENTRRLVRGEDVDPQKCLFINPQIERMDDLVIQLVQPVWTAKRDRKMSLDKHGLEKRASPDRFDAASLAFAYDSASGLRASQWERPA